MSAALSGRSGSQCGMGGAVFGLVCESRGHGELDATHAGAHKRADLEQLEADGAAGGAGELSMSQADAAQGAQQHIGHRGKPQPQLVGAHRFGRGAIGVKVELALPRFREGRLLMRFSISPRAQ